MFKKLLLVLGLSLCILNPLYAQEKKGLIYTYSDFSGGLNTKLSSLYLPQNQSTLVENCRFNSELKSLSKREQIMLYGSADSTEPILGMHRLYLKDGTKVLLVNHGDEIEKGNDATGGFTTILNLTTGDYHWQWLTWHNEAIGTDGYNQPVKYDGTSASATYLGSCLATALTSGTALNGTYTYKVIFYTTPSNYIVAFNILSNSVTVSSKDVALSMIPIGPDTYGGEDVLGRRVYRNLNGTSTYKLLTNGEIIDNSTTAITDSTTDATLTNNASYPTPTVTYTPPKGRFLLLHGNRLWIANDPSYPSRIYYSDDSNPDYFIPTDYYDVRPNDGDEITFIKNLLGTLTVGKTNTIQKIYTDGDTPELDWAISDPFSFVGCRAPYTAKETPLGIVYRANDGIYKFTGQYSTLISDAVTPVINDIASSNLNNCWAEYHKNMYYLAYASKASGESDNNRVLVFDLLSNAYSIDLLSLNAFCTLNSGSDQDVLYSGSSTNGNIYAHTLAPNEIVTRSQSDLSGTFTNARYLPTRWSGDANNPVIEISRTETIDDLTGTINELTGTIDRSTTTGDYISPVSNASIYSLDKIYWNERLPSVGGDVTLDIRTATSDTTITSASWSTGFTNPAGSDISAVPVAGNYLQYRINLTTNNILDTPIVYKANGYIVKILYNVQGSVAETTIPFHWVSGWSDFGYPQYEKLLRKIEVYYESEGVGTLNLKFSNYEGDSDTFAIDLSKNPNHYEEYFTGGVLRGQQFDLDISESSLKRLKVRQINLIYDIEPLV